MANNDLDAPTTRRDLRDLRIELVDRMQRLEREQISLRKTLIGVRNTVWLAVASPILSLITAAILHKLNIL
jgi:hypothetical protein